MPALELSSDRGDIRSSQKQRIANRQSALARFHVSNSEGGMNGVEIGLPQFEWLAYSETRLAISEVSP
jgi:hypothetical protein